MYTTEPVALTLRPSPQEDQLAEDYASVLGTVSRIDRAVRDGAWNAVRDELDQLISAAEDMWSTLSEPDDGEENGDHELYQAPVTVTADPATVCRLIGVYAEPHSIGHVLHPTAGPRGAEGEDPSLPAQEGAPEGRSASCP
ncbi:hypothetical protein [Streptomyces albireticuli]|uniref:Uncharacterized protein n=1 Tax=Streptomyces albireticuli TaxID=1940 RepID=A0A2A2D8B3_9ACTN|nr:hypothetical protein [Streptomyces albireticuli]MCD9194631.1 hypothetical protein [Streptomyces albireticuli]PAU47686.1 hypothetical protein CK936_17345 [Streptomyces albireticuli]